MPDWRLHLEVGKSTTAGIKSYNNAILYLRFFINLTHGLIMRFSVQLHNTEVAELLSRLILITGIAPWKKRFDWLQREISENSFMESWLRERCLLEWTMNDVLASPQLKMYEPFPIESIAQYELIEFAAGTVRAYERLSEKGQRRLRGVLLDGLKEDKGLLSIQHEITTAIHLMSRGFDVDFHDMDNGGGFDYIARKNDIEIEVECKMFSADLGRKIHRRRSATLFKTLEGILKQTLSAASTGLLVMVKIPDRLTPSPNQHRGIEEAVRAGVLNGDGLIKNDHCSVRVIDLPTNKNLFVDFFENTSKKELSDFIQSKTGLSNSTAIAFFTPQRRAIILALESDKSDDVLNGMRHQLREAANGQFSKKRPAILAVQLHDLSADQIENLADLDSPFRRNASGLQTMTSDFLMSPSRSHIHTITYRSHGLLGSDGNGTRQASGLAYSIKNGFHTSYKDARFDVFGA